MLNNTNEICDAECTFNAHFVSKSEHDDILFRLSELFKLISDMTRIRILLALEGGALCVCEIADALGMTKSAVSHQLKSLRDGNLIKSRKNGKHVYYELADSHVKDIIDKTIEHVSEK